MRISATPPVVTDQTTGSSPAARVTSSLFFICLVAFVALALATDHGERDRVLSWLYRPAYDIWHGSYWALVTSSLVHVELWHLLGNLYWMWMLGGPLERAIGPGRFAVFVVAAGFIASAYELAVSDGTGFGASGIVYALVGFVWIARGRFAELRGVPTSQILAFFIAWQLACFALTHSGVLNVANAAHVTGLVFGMLVGALATGWRPRLVIASLASSMLFASLIAAWCPWSPSYVGGLAYDAHVAGNLREALHLYTEALRLDPENAWAYYNRSEVFASLGDARNARADLLRAQSLESGTAPADRASGGSTQ